VRPAGTHSVWRRCEPVCRGAMTGLTISHEPNTRRPLQVVLHHPEHHLDVTAGPPESRQVMCFQLLGAPSNGLELPQHLCGARAVSVPPTVPLVHRLHRIASPVGTHPLSARCAPGNWSTVVLLVLSKRASGGRWCSAARSTASMSRLRGLVASRRRHIQRSREFLDE
jgi:hypothetical protein